MQYEKSGTLKSATWTECKSDKVQLDKSVCWEGYSLEIVLNEISLKWNDRNCERVFCKKNSVWKVALRKKIKKEIV